MLNFEIKRPTASASTPTMLAFIAAIGATGWAAADIKPFKTSHTQSTVSIALSQLSVQKGESSANFARQMARLYADLAANQSQLGADFEAAWEANARELFEA